MATANNTKVWDWLFKIMSALVIPLVLWGVKLEVKNAVQNEKIVQLEKDLAAAADVEKEVRLNTQALGRLEEKLNAANTNLSEIKRLLRQP